MMDADYQNAGGGVGCEPAESNHEEDLPCERECVFGAAGQRRWETRHYGGGDWEFEEASSGTGEDCVVAWEPVRVLYAGDCYGEYTSAGRMERVQWLIWGSGRVFMLL